MKAITIASRGRRARTASLALGLLVLGLTVWAGLPYAVMQQNAALAVQINPWNTDALTARASELLQAGQGKQVAPEIAALSRSAVAKAPLTPFALRNYGFALEVEGKRDMARPIIDLAAQVSLRDILSHALLLERHYREKRIPDAVRSADVVLSQREDTYLQIMPGIVRLLDDPSTIEPLARTLARRPVWRGPFLERMGLERGNYPAKFQLVHLLQRYGAPAEASELTALLRSAGADLDGRQVRRHWDRLVPLPPQERGRLLLDGEFELGALPPPFAWSYRPADGVYAEATARPDGKGRALFASFEGRARTYFAGQHLLLAPGRYRLSGAALGQDEVSRGQFSWLVRCEGPNDRVSEAEFPIAQNADDWASFAYAIDIPADCTDQQLYLIGAVGEGGKVASIWIDSVRLTRL
jgi:hypothetical protein